MSNTATTKDKIGYNGRSAPNFKARLMSRLGERESQMHLGRFRTERSQATLLLSSRWGLISAC